MPKTDDHNRDLLIEYFKNKCVRCGRPNPTIHEIVPKSQRPQTWQDPLNRVALCYYCHEMVHNAGAKNFRTELRALRQRFVEINGSFSDFLERKGQYGK